MAYSWEENSLQMYGEKITLSLIKQQQEYENKNKDNNCDHCGKGNEGSIVEWSENHPVIIHYGLWCNGQCSYCGKYEQ